MNKDNHIDLIEFPAQSTEEVRKTTTFFSDVFGWNFKDWGGAYADTSDSGVMVGVNAVAEKRQSMPLAVVYAKDLSTTKDKIEKAGGTITQDIYEFPGGKRFHFKDPAGNELAVWSE